MNQGKKKKCPKCGYTENAVDALECSHCKTNLKEYQKEKQNRLLRPCRVCKKVISINAISCPHCGEPYSDRACNSRTVVNKNRLNDISVIESLFDWSFSGFATPTIIRIVYVVNFILYGLFACGIIIASFFQSVGYGLVMLLVSPAVFFLFMLMMRMSSEIVNVVFKIEKNTNR